MDGSIFGSDFFKAVVQTQQTYLKQIKLEEIDLFPETQYSIDSDNNFKQLWEKIDNSKVF